MITTITLVCDHCNLSFERKLSRHKQNIAKGKSKRTYCTRQCSDLARPASTVTFNCINCKKTVTKPKCSKVAFKFCTHLCSIQFNEVTNKCKNFNDCGNNSALKRVFCSDCQQIFNSVGGRRRLGYIRQSVLDQTLQELKDNRKLSDYHSVLRANSRVVYGKSSRGMSCLVCNYSKHVDVCHIKDVKDFAMDSPISVVNSPDNLVALCKNHHWEFDHDTLDGVIVAGKGIEPFYVANEATFVPDSQLTLV